MASPGPPNAEAEGRPAEPALRRRSLAASALFHAAILAALIGLWRSVPTPEEPLVQVRVVTEGPGAAGAAGGDAGGGGHAPDASSPPAETAAIPETAQDSAQPPVPVGQEAPLPAEPPPQHKPKPPRPRTTPHRPTPASTAHRPLPQPEPAQIAAAPLPAPAPGTPGAQGGPERGVGAGQGAEGAGPGAAGEGPSGSPGDDYLERVRRWIRRFQHYPAEASRQKQQGTAVLDITLARDGTVLAVAVERSSGFPLIDAAAVKAVYDASPVPPFPESYRKERGTMVMPAIYSLGFFERLF